MRKLLTIIAFSVFFLVPLGVQNAFAGQPNQCAGMIDGTPCDDGDGNVCNSSCQAEICTTGTSADAGTSCSDGNQCTGPDTCNGAGFCQSGPPLQIPMCIDTVGGEIIPIESTSMILAGSQMTAAWLIPIIVSASGFAIVISRKF